MQAQSVRSTRFVGVKPCLDFKVGHSDHNYYAEGIVVSNSHCAAYSYITAQTVYLKANHPTEFILSLFRMARHEIDSQECISTIMNEARGMGVKVSPPDILRSESDFSIHNGVILFGLSSIKGVSDATMAKLGSFKQVFPTQFHLFEAAASAKVPINVLTSLIYAGCMDTKGKARSLVALHAQLYNLLTDREKPLIHRLAGEYAEDLIAILKALPEKRTETGKPLIRESRLTTLRRDYEPYWRMYHQNSSNEDLTSYLYERHLLGFSYSGTLHGCYSLKVTGLISLSDLSLRAIRVRDEAAKVMATLVPGAKPPATPRQEPLRFVAFVDEAKSHVAKASGKPYLKLDMSDDSHTVKVMVFGADRLEAHKGFNGRVAAEGDLCIVSGSLSKDGGIIFADSVIIQPAPVAFKKAAVEQPI